MRSRPAGIFRFFAIILLTLMVANISRFTLAAPNAQASGPALSVNAALNQHPISPNIYGMNTDVVEAFANELKLPIRRWGGNLTTRYNWQIDAANHANDYFFENLVQDTPNPATLPDGSTADLFIEQDKRTGTQTLITIPLIGWTAKSRATLCAFDVRKYGPQKAVDPYDPHCGNGIKPDGSLVTGNDPTDASTAIDPSFAQGWINHLTGRYGTAANGGVAFYALDNEPNIWNSTHRDVHPNPLSYDQLFSLGTQYGAAIKQADPSAQVTGPVDCCWTYYFYSGLDASAGGQWWLNPQDRNAHGGTPLTEWYLQQMRSYEQAHGTRLLDYLDLHYYPEEANIALAPAGDAATQALRLKSTRALWDPTYVSESWINDTVQLIPRMHTWVTNDYPGTKIAISEYNWGGLESINGALAQADVLGIFGREGVDLATIWGPPTPDQPGAYAFRMYRNYDGQGGLFGAKGVTASSADQSQLAIYGALRGPDTLTLMIINKTGNDLTSSVALAGFTPSVNAQVYRYSSANLSKIVRQADQAVSVSGFNATFPANSITLVVIPAQNSQPTATPAVTNTPTATGTLAPARVDTIGIYRNGTFYLRNANTTGVADITVAFGAAGMYPVVGDWQGARIDTVGVYDRSNGLFQLRYSNTSGAADAQLVLGVAGDQPLSGHWTGSAAHDGVGVFRPSNGLIYLRNDLSTGYADDTMVLGLPGDVGVAGDWLGGGIDSPGVYRPSLQHFYLSNQVCNCSVYGDFDLQLGLSGDVPVVGDWVAQGHDGVGVFRPSNGLIYLKNQLVTGYADNTLVYGIPNDIPIAGHWTNGAQPSRSALIVSPTQATSIAPSVPARTATLPASGFDG